MKPTHYAAFIAWADTLPAGARQNIRKALDTPDNKCPSITIQAWEAGRKHSSILEILRRFFRGMRG